MSQYSARELQILTHGPNTSMDIIKIRKKKKTAICLFKLKYLNASHSTFILEY